MSLDSTQVQAISAIVMAIATVILVIVTGYYVREVKKSREDVWKLEKKRKKEENEKEENEKIQLKGLLAVELILNLSYLETLLETIRGTKSSYKEQKFTKLPELPFYKDSVYKTILKDLKIFSYETTLEIIEIYTLIELDQFYYDLTKEKIKKILEKEISPTDLKFIKNNLNALEIDFSREISSIRSWIKIYEGELTLLMLEKKEKEKIKKLNEILKKHI